MNDQTIPSLRRRLPVIDDASVNLGATIKPTLRMRPAEPVPRVDRTWPRATTAVERESAQPAGYDILGELGRGGIGIVYRARQRTLKREVALKRLQSADDALRQAFLAESMVTGELEHPNIVPVYALCEEE